MYLLNKLAKLVLVVVMVFCYIGLAAQDRYNIKLSIKDKTTEETVGFATVSIRIGEATKALSYALSNSNGEAILEKVPTGKYKLIVEMMGYKPFSKEIEVKSDINLGKISIEQDVEQLNAAKVSGIANAIEFKKDTIEYNASSFKTSDNDMLEDLLKKLPGVEVESDGSITANGETIKKIMIDGKTFFLDDPQLASKNLPAKIVEKVRVVEKKSEQAQFTGINDGEEETILDLSVRPGMMNGWFGNAMAGVGHDLPQKNTYTSFEDALDEDWRYQGAAMTGYFTEDTQISVILNGNNTNDRGFNDLSGSMMGSMRGGGMGRGSSHGSSSNGITTSWMAGLNANFSLFDDDMDLGGNYVYSGSNTNVEELSSRVTYMEDGSKLLYDNDGFNITNTQGHRFGVRLDHKFSEKTSILFQPQFEFGNGNYNEYNNFLSEKDLVNGNRDKLNEGFSNNTGINDNFTARGFLLFRQRLGKPGRTISAMMNYNFSKNNLDGLNQSFTENFSASADTPDAEVINQRIDRTSDRASFSGEIKYTEPIYKEMVFLEAAYSYDWGKSTSIKDAYLSSSDEIMVDDLGNKQLIYNSVGELKDDIYSNSVLNRSIDHEASLTFKYQKDKLTTLLGAEVNPTTTFNETNGETYSSQVLNWAPRAGIFYDFNDNMNIRGFYYGNSSQPSTSQLMPVADNSNPLNISFGNPYLTPYFTHNLRSRFGLTNRRTFTSLYVMLYGGLTQNPIVNASWYDPKGVQYSMPVNGSTRGNINTNIMFSSPIAKSAFSVSSTTSASYANSNSFIGTSKLATDKYYDPATAEFNYKLFNEDFKKNDDLDLFSSNTTQTLSINERLRFTYKSELVNLTLGGRTRYSESWYSLDNKNKNTTWNNRAEFEMNWSLPGGINIISDLNYNWYDGYSTPIQDEFIFNAEITKLLLKNKMTLAIRGYDIFNQAKNVSVVNNENYFQENINNTLGRYIILSLTYRFGKFEGKGMGGYGHGPGGHGGPRR